MKKAVTIITITGVFFLLCFFGNFSGNVYALGASEPGQTSSKSVQTKPKSAQTTSKSTQTKPKTTKAGTKAPQAKPKPAPAKPKPEPAKARDAAAVKIGTQAWAIANLNVTTFRNGDTIPEAKTNKEWVAAGEAGKPAWCNYNNDPKYGLKYGKLYNWFAVNDPRGLAPEGWKLSGDADWAILSNSLGGVGVAGDKMKSNSGWADGNNGTNETGFTGLPGGYRVENGAFLNLGSIGIWWSSTEGNTASAVDHYLVLSGSLGKSSSPKQRGASVRCLR